MSAAVPHAGFWVRLFLPDGEPHGVKLVEKSNWTGCGLVIPRGFLLDVKARQELSRPGVYLLVGPQENSNLPRAWAIG